MIISWNWLKEYVDLDMSADELANRLAMSGLNHEGTDEVGNDLAIDLEVTSNRPDCLGHIGVAREVAVLWNKQLSIPQIVLDESSTPADELVKVRIDCPELCSRYTARVIQGVKVGPSPPWLVERLETLGIPSISNVVDITNYVMMECGQPLHAFDLAKINERSIVVRAAQPKEPFTAIDHNTYELTGEMCVIADAQRSVALGGVMGGADTEVCENTVDVLIEAADFAPLSIRSTARALRLHSPSSYRFERTVDPEGIDWASRRACQLVLQLAGGQLADGVVDVQAKPVPPNEPVVLRFSQIKRVLGIELDRDRIIKILTELGMQSTRNDADSATFERPSWRRDLTREIDLIEEVARIHGYEEIPEDVGVPMVPSHRQDQHRVLSHVRNVLTAAGFHEAMTASVVDEKTSQRFSPWTDADPIQCSTPMLRGANCLRRSLVPSLLESRRVNESLANDPIELFETAKVYLPTSKGLPEEYWALALTSGHDFRQVKGVIEAVLTALHITTPLDALPYRSDFLDPNGCCQLELDGQLLGFLGAVNKQGRKSAALRHETVIAELRLSVLETHCNLVPQQAALSQYPAINYDFNFVVAEKVRWSELASTVRQAAGALAESVNYQETYRDPKRDGAGRKRLLLSVRLRSHQATISGEQAEEVRTAIIDACKSSHAAELLHA